MRSLEGVLRRGSIRRSGPAACLVLGLAVSSAPASGPAAQSLPIAFSQQPGSVSIRVGGRPFARYVYSDPEVLRPYFCDVREPGGVQVTRTHPPVEGRDPVDHGTMHPGLWLAFGEVNGADFWRNRGRVEQVRFLAEPQSTGSLGRFSVEKRYTAPDGKTLAREVCRYTIVPRLAGTLLVSDSELAPEGESLAFGDQEEMGFGLRVATPITVRSGGRIRNSDGAMNEKAVWGKQADWCDYSGVVEGRRVGACLIPGPKNFRRSWFHARDYGLLVANPFGRKAFGAGDPSAVTVAKGERLRLRFAVLVHGGKDEPDLAATYQDALRFLQD